MKFNKFNSTDFSDALLKEADGLTCLQNKLDSNFIPIKTPQVYAVDEQTLVLERIDDIGGSKTQWQQFGHDLARLHLLQENTYGWHENNYIGMNPQINRDTANWGEFFLNQRLAYQINLIIDPVILERFKQSLSSVEKQLIAFLNDHCPFSSLLHGDLWSGNVLFDDQSVWLIDPAIYRGDAEADIAMTELFGGFPVAFYQAYTELKPMSNQYAMKKVIYNLYHQLNHYNLFGSGYLSACKKGFATLKEL